MAAFKEGDAVLAQQMNMIYEAKVLKTRMEAGKTEYFVHYNGWAKRWDEWLDSTRVMPDNEPNRSLAARVNEEAKAAAASKKGKKDDTSMDGSAAAGSKRKQDGGKDAEDGDVDGDGTLSLVLPFTLKRHLVDDWENVAHKRMLLRLPQPPGAATVNTVLEAFVAYLATGTPLEAERDSAKPKKKAKDDKGGAVVSTPTAESASTPTHTHASASNPAFAVANVASLPAHVRGPKDVLDGLRQYFDRALPIYLLYRFERSHFEAFEVGNRAERKLLHACVSPVFLLRLFVRLPELLHHASLGKDEAEVLSSTINDLFKFMTKYASNYLTSEDYVAAPADYSAAFDAAASAAAPANTAAATQGIAAQ